MPTEADTCRRFVVPKLQAAGWDNEPYSIAEQRTITDGRIVPVGKSFIRRPSKRVDYLLRYRRDFSLAVVEAKPEYKTAADGLQQSKEYAEMLGLKFASASNGPDIIEFDYFTGLEKWLAGYPSPEELWHRYRNGQKLKDDKAAQQLLTPINFALRQGERYYPRHDPPLLAIVTGTRRVLLTMATGTGKTRSLFRFAVQTHGHHYSSP
jgi:type I restriction enzyme, R subunit